MYTNKGNKGDSSQEKEGVGASNKPDSDSIFIYTDPLSFGI